MLTSGRRRFLKNVAASLAALPLVHGVTSSAEARKSFNAGERPSAAATPPPKGTVRLNVRDLGATGNGTTKDTLAIQQSLDRCNVLGGGEVLLPAGDYLTGTLVIRSNTTLRFDDHASLLGSPDLADYPLTQVRWEGHWIQGYSALITADEARSIALIGKGTIVGNQAIKGRVDRQSGLRHPALLEFTNCIDVRVQDCVTQQNDMWSIHPTYCDTVVFQNVTVNGGADGIDVDSCKHVIIDGCNFSTGDDCISLKSGRGEEGNTIDRPTEDVRISNCTFRDVRWACIGIGSETSAGIRDVWVQHCKCLSAGTFAIYIKSRPGRGAFIENIFMNDLDVSGAKDGFLRINTLNSGKHDAFPVPGNEGIPALRNFRFSNIRVTAEPVLVDASAIHPHKPLVGLSISDVTGTCERGMYLANIRDARLRNVRVTGYSGALLNTYQVQGKGLAGAASLERTHAEPEIPPPATPYVLR